MPTKTSARITQPPSRAWDSLLLSGGTDNTDSDWLAAPHEQGAAISPDAAQLQIVIHHFCERVVRDWQARGVSPTVAEERGRQQFRDRLHASFDAEPFEDGMSHPAEQLISEALESRNASAVLRWIRSICLDSSNPAFAAAVFLCVARQPEVGTAQWRAGLVRGGLGVDDVEVRDAAIQAAEYWGDSGLRPILSAHTEPIGWLDEYRRGVMDDLGG